MPLRTKIIKKANLIFFWCHHPKLILFYYEKFLVGAFVLCSHMNVFLETIIRMLENFASIKTLWGHGWTLLFALLRDPCY